jgi:hypothetical protein
MGEKVDGNRVINWRMSECIIESLEWVGDGMDEWVDVYMMGDRMSGWADRAVWKKRNGTNLRCGHT